MQVYANFAFVFSSTRRHTRCALVAGVQTCALPISLLAWLALPASRPLAARERQRLNWAGVRSAARLPAVWAQATVIVCAYVAYKVTDIFGLYAHDVLGYDEVAAARIGEIGRAHV